MTEPALQRHSFEVRPTSDSHFGWIRTRLSLERTIMSWVRTSVSLIGFGFTIVQFFERSTRGRRCPGVSAGSPRCLGLSLIAAGVLALVISVWQYRSVARYLLGKEFEPIAGLGETVVHTPLYLIAIALMFIGLFAFRSDGS